MPKQRHLRSGDVPPDDDTLVVRGGALDSEILRTDARRYHAVYGTYGISVFALRNLPVDELAQVAPLVRFAVLTLARVESLRSARLRLEPTGRNPSHFTVAFDDLDVGVDALAACEHWTWINPYHDD